MIEVNHPNGYKGVMYGCSSLSIYNPEGKEVMHTGFRKIQFENELYKFLEEFPDFWYKITQLFNDKEDESVVDDL